MNKIRIVTKNEEETRKVAKTLLKEWFSLNKKNDSSWLVCLRGDLGGGKTTFAKGLAEELGVKETVGSPTFVIMKKYISSKSANKKYILYHFDCYRIHDPKDVLDLGWEEIIEGKNNIILVEWPERIEKVLPEKKLNVKFDFIDETSRSISFY